ncbi:hypothetical protein KCP71_06735 [Salmonella enterica subsp. enterica]|nr:hypothetical protein KCP71_06735 [Salmonella enterica subsp. enterica]
MGLSLTQRNAISATIATALRRPSLSWDKESYRAVDGSSPIAGYGWSLYSRSCQPVLPASNS